MLAMRISDVVTSVPALGQAYLQYRRIMEHWNDVLPGKVLDVHYEQMVGGQEAQTRLLLKHCGLPWEDQPDALR
jgi:hypothetical protein